MFEEVPRERRGVARWLLAHSIGVKPVVVRPVVVRPFVLRPLAVGPFVLGGGLLLGAVGGSVAVAAAATVLTASAIGSDDVPPRPPQAASAASPAHSAPARSSAHQPVAVPAPATSAERRSGSVTSSAAAPAVTAGPASPSGGASAADPTPASSPADSSVPAVAPVPGSPAPTPSSSGPLGNALVHVSGYDPATGRLAYQFAVADPHGSAGTRYLISGPETFSAVLAPGAGIVSGGTLCPPAGSACTFDQLIAAAGHGFFAEVAIDVTGTLRSVVEVGEQSEAAELAPVPSASAAPAGRLSHPGGRPPAPSAGRAGLSEPAPSLST